MANILLMGVYGEVGQSFYQSLKDENEVYSFINPDKPNQYEKLHGLYLDCYQLEDMKKAVQGMDVIIFYEDPIMRFAKINQGRFDTFLQLIADNVGRAAENSSVKRIVHVSEEISHETVKNILEAYDTPVIHTKTELKRFGKSLKYKNPENETMRSAQHAPLPSGWTLEGVAKYYFNWLDTIVFGIAEINYYGDTVEIRLPAFDKAMIVMRRDKSSEEKDIIIYRIIGGSLPGKDVNAMFEFRALPGNEAFIMMLHDYTSRLPWVIYAMTQAPLHGLVSRVYQVEMVINSTLLEENEKNNPE